MISVLKNNLLWQHGKYIVLTILISSIFSFLFFKPLLFLLSGLFIFCLYFFRNPNRECKEFNTDNSILISPADGKIVEISDGMFEGYQKKISIFLSPIDVHVNWIPNSGVVKAINYRAGKFVVAYASKSSEINERNDIIIACDNGNELLIRQIAGYVARRICCWIRKGDVAMAGYKFGMIRFGSRVDIFLPSNVDIYVSVGDRLKGGESVLGRWK